MSSSYLSIYKPWNVIVESFSVAIAQSSRSQILQDNLPKQVGTSTKRFFRGPSFTGQGISKLMFPGKSPSFNWTRWSVRSGILPSHSMSDHCGWILRAVGRGAVYASAPSGLALFNGSDGGRCVPGDSDDVGSEQSPRGGSEGAGGGPSWLGQWPIGGSLGGRGGHKKLVNHPSSPERSWKKYKNTHNTIS